MPVVSQAQNRFMHWAQENPQESGVPKKVSTDFINATHGMSVKSMPKRVGDKPKKRKMFGSLAP